MVGEENVVLRSCSWLLSADSRSEWPASLQRQPDSKTKVELAPGTVEQKSQGELAPRTDDGAVVMANVCWTLVAK